MRCSRRRRRAENEREKEKQARVNEEKEEKEEDVSRQARGPFGRLLAADDAHCREGREREREKCRFFPRFAPSATTTTTCAGRLAHYFSPSLTQITILRQHTHLHSSCRCEGAVRSSKE